MKYSPETIQLTAEEALVLRAFATMTKDFCDSHDCTNCRLEYACDGHLKTHAHTAIPEFVETFLNKFYE